MIWVWDSPKFDAQLRRLGAGVIGMFYLCPENFTNRWQAVYSVDDSLK